MRTRSKLGRLKRAGAGGVVAALGASAALVTVGGAPASSQSEDTQTATFEYSCVFPQILEQPVEIEVTIDIPTEVPTGAPRTYHFEGPAVTNEETADILYNIGVRHLEGTAEMAAFLDAPNMQVPVTANADVARSPVPEDPAGGVELPFSGDTLAFGFDESNVGAGVVTLGDMTLNMRALNADGNLTYPNEFEAPCTLAEGSNDVLAEFTIGDCEGDECEPDPEDPPATPTGLAASGVTDTGADLSWGAADFATGYDVHVGPAGSDLPLDQSVSGTSATVTDLEPETDYEAYVVATNAVGESDPSETIAFTTEEEGEDPPDPTDPLEFSFDLEGESFIAAANGTTPLSGDIVTRWDPADNSVDADLNLEPNTGTFNILNFLNTTADIEFEQVGNTTGSFDVATGELKSHSEMNVTLASVNAFGFLPIGGGPDCTTVEPMAVDLANPDGEPFDPFDDGGSLEGDYTLPALDVEQCGFLGSIISAFMAGPGNTIDMDLTPTG